MASGSRSCTDLPGDNGEKSLFWKCHMKQMHNWHLISRTMSYILKMRGCGGSRQSVGFEFFFLWCSRNVADCPSCFNWENLSQGWRGGEVIDHTTQKTWESKIRGTLHCGAAEITVHLKKVANDHRNHCSCHCYYLYCRLSGGTTDSTPLLPQIFHILTLKNTWYHCQYIHALDALDACIS